MKAAGELFRFNLKADRRRCLIWLVSLAALTLGSVAGYRSAYPTEADLIARAKLIEGNAATIAFTGPGYGLNHPTLGNMLANELLGMLAVAVALMSIFQVIRRTRAEEEDGVAELVGAGPVGRRARSVAAFGLACGLNLVVAVTLAIGLMAVGLGAGGALSFAAGIAACGVVFGALALLSAQVSEHARVASSLAGAALGASYLLRAVGDIGGGVLSWFSPIGWAQAMRPFAGDRWLPMLIFAGATVFFLVAAFVLEGRRDLGGGLARPRPGPGAAGRLLSGFAGLPLRLQRVALLSWTAGALVIGVVYGSVATEVTGLLADNPNLERYLAQTGGDLVDSFFVTTVMVVALIATGFSIQSLTRIRAEEIAGRAEEALARPVGRGHWLAEFAAVALAGVISILIAGGLGLAAGYALAGGGADRMLQLPLAALASGPAVLVMAGFTAALIGVAPRFTGFAWLVLAGVVFLGFFGEGLSLPVWIRDLSPFEHLPAVPAVAASAEPLITMSLLGLALAAVGLVSFRRRDIG